MSIKRGFKILLAKGIMWSKNKTTRDGRGGYDTLNDALNDLAKKNCCGIECCGDVTNIYLKPTNSSTPVLAQIELDGGGNPTWVFSTVEE